MRKGSERDGVHDTSISDAYSARKAGSPGLDQVITSLPELQDGDIAKLRAAVRAECRRRKLADSVGAHGEHVAIEYFASRPGLPVLQAAPTGTKNVDALSRSGERYSIKTICDGAKTGTIYPDTNDPNKQLFENLLIVKLAPDWSLISIHQLTWDVFVEVRAWDKRMNAWYVGFSRRVLAKAKLVTSEGDRP
jgi:hypothetical protein